MSEEDILHELKESYQWRLDRELSSKNETDYLKKFSEKFNPRRLLSEQNKDIRDYYDSQLHWQFAVPDKNRTLVAILLDSFLEIRHERDDYEKPIGRASVVPDTHPKWRKIAWSSDGILVAISSSNGELRCYNTLANLVCSISNVDHAYDSSSAIPTGAIVSLFFLETRTKSAEWPYELLALDFQGGLKSYFISSTEGYKPYHTFVFGDDILTAACYVPSFNILVIAFPTPSITQRNADDVLGLSTWRLLNDHPYYRLVKPNIENLSRFKKRNRWLSILTRSKRIVVLKMSVSLDGAYLSCLYSCGSVIIWTLPPLKIHQTWQRQDLHESVNVEQKVGDVESTLTQERTMLDVNWCLDTVKDRPYQKLAMLRGNGSLVVCSLNKPDNLLAEINPKFHEVDRTPQQLNPCAKLANVCDLNTGFLVLTCKFKEFSSWRRDSEIVDTSVETNQDANLSSQAIDVSESHSLLRQIVKFLIHFEMFRQQKINSYVERIYSLMTFKKVTAEELYERKLDNEEYDDALDFARLFKLDENRVYKKQWKNSRPVTTESIKNYLLKITDQWWIIEECCQRIPETLFVAQELLEYGLRFTDFNSFVAAAELSDNVDSSSMTSENETFPSFNVDETTKTCFPQYQRRILFLRRQILSHWDALLVYKEIIEVNPQKTKYDEKTFEKIRNEAHSSVAVYFAREGNANAVNILFTYFREELHPYWLNILDNFPESVKPSEYSVLLPRYDEAGELVRWKCKRLREVDWSESGEFKDIEPLKKSEGFVSHASFPFSKTIVTDWYESRIRRIIEKSDLISYALELLNLAIKNNIPGLDQLRHNLLVLDTLVYDLLIEEDISLTEVEKLSHFDQLRLIMSKMNTEEFFFDNISNILLPFLSRCEMLRPNTQDELLDQYLKHLSRDDLNSPLMFFMYVNEKHEDDMFFSDKRISELALLSIYACQRVDQIEVARRIIELLPELSDNNNLNYEEIFDLRSKLNELQSELDVMELLQYYCIKKCLNFLHDNKNNAQFQKTILTAMVNAKASTRLISREEINALLKDLVFVQDNLFGSLSNETYMRVFAYTMLTMGRNDCIEEYAPMVLYSSSSRRVHNSWQNNAALCFDESAAIIVEAAQYYFNNASCYDDPNVSSAEACLSLINFHPDVERERQLINALKVLNEFGVQIAPLEVRMSVNKRKIIDKIIKAKPKSYENIERLLTLARNLNFDSDDKNALELDVLNCSVNAALEFKDYSWCSTTASKLIENKKQCWSICKKLCECDDYDDLETKHRLIKFVTMFCPDNELENMTELRNEIERKTLRKSLQKSIQTLQNSQIEQNCRDTKNHGFKMSSTRPFPEFDSIQGLVSIPSFVNMLHASSSTVLDINFWKNTFKLSSSSANRAFERDTNVKCARLGFPEFYGDVHKDCNCLCFANNVEEETHMLRLLLKFYVSGRKGGECVENTVNDDINDAIAQLCVRTFPSDCVSSLCLLLLLRDDRVDAKIFDSLPRTIPVEKFALYYYCLKFVLNDNSTNNDEIIIKSPSEIISQTLTSLESTNSSYATRIFKYKTLLDCGIDFARFFTDETYKIDSILGIAMYEERDKLDLALSLGAEYGVREEDITVSHLSSLFFSNNVIMLKDTLEDPFVLDTLKKDAQYAARKIVTDIYEGLPGNDDRILLLFYALLKYVAEEDEFHCLKPEEHMKLLKILRPFMKNLDYKILLTEPSRIVDIFSKCVTIDDYDKSINVLLSLPTKLITNINLEGAFQKLIQNATRNNHKKEVIDKLKNFLKRFARMNELSKICDEYDIDEQYSDALRMAIKCDDTSNLNAVVSKMTLDSSMPTDVIKIIVDGIDPNLLTNVITNFVENELQSDELEMILDRIADCLEANEYEIRWCDSLQSLLDKSVLRHDTSVKIQKLLSILKLSEDELNNKIDSLHETRLILREWIAAHSRITIYDIVDENSRLNLVRQLINEAISFSQLSYLFNLLVFFSSSVDCVNWENDVWIMLLEKLLSLNEENVTNEQLKLVNKIMTKKKLTQETKRKFFDRLHGIDHNRTLLVWYCILSNDDLLIESVNYYIEDLRLNRKMPKMMEEYLITRKSR